MVLFLSSTSKADPTLITTVRAALSVSIAVRVSLVALDEVLLSKATMALTHQVCSLQFLRLR